MNEHGGIPSGTIPPAVWEAAGHPDQPGYPEALTELLDCIVILPSVVSVRVPEGKLNDPDWHMIVLTTIPTCLCGSRRLLLPPVQHDWVPTGTEPLIAIDAEHPLELAPWGGDQQSTLLRLTIDENGSALRGQLLPYEQAYWPVRHPDWPDGQRGFHALASLSLMCQASRRVFFGVPCGNGVYTALCCVESIDEQAGSVHVRISPWAIRAEGTGEPGHACGTAASP